MMLIQVMSFNPILESTISLKRLQAHLPPPKKILEIFIVLNEKDI